MAADFQASSFSRRPPVSQYLPDFDLPSITRRPSPLSVLPRSPPSPPSYATPPAIPPQKVSRAMHLYNQYRTMDANYCGFYLTSYTAFIAGRVFMNRWVRSGITDGNPTATPKSHASTEAVCGSARSTNSTQSCLQRYGETQSHEGFRLGLHPPVELGSVPHWHPNYGNDNEEMLKSTDSREEWPWSCYKCSTESGILSVEESSGWFRNSCDDCSVDTENITPEMD